MNNRKLPFSEPDPAGSERARIAKQVRDLATEVSRLQPQATTRTNEEEADHGHPFPANFTKGLEHDENGVLTEAEHYRCFVEAINSPDRTLFEKSVLTGEDAIIQPPVKKDDVSKDKGKGKNQNPCCKEKKDDKTIKWRGWESPRSGHAYDLEGPDAGATGMAPAPRVGSSELAFEMAEVYALALLRDVPFEEIRQGGQKQLCDKAGDAVLSAQEAVDALNAMRFIKDKEDLKKDDKKRVSSTPFQVDETDLNRFERNRRYGRLQGKNELTCETAFRGSTPGALRGPYISQFMLIGNEGRKGKGLGGGRGSFPGLDSFYDLQDGFINYGTLVIDQRTVTHKACLDHMTTWCDWLNVQNGADLRNTDKYEKERRFITTPRDLATYVHFDALYEAYLNACLVMIGMEIPTSKGFPEPSPSGRRGAFATFGGPHILSLVTEVATRCLKSVRRQKFNHHRRARPEALGGRLTLQHLDLGCKLGGARDAFAATLEELGESTGLLEKIVEHNDKQNSICDRSCSVLPCGVTQDKFDKHNLLLPMAFPEGSPMHPAYGAGHATVAGGCVTMLKAFFEMFDDGNSGQERVLKLGGANAYVPNSDGTALVRDNATNSPLTVQGELDKLAANISVGRNMAGVHYYSDYYDSARLGERIAVGILLEQSPTYGDYVETTFTSFDGDHITISGEAGSCPSLTVLDRNGNSIAPSEWWLRHVSGQAFSEDL